MPERQQIRIQIDKSILAEAKKLGLDISRTCERALERRVAALKAFEGKEKLDTMEG